MGVNHHVKTKYVFRLQLPLPFFRSKPMDRKGKRVDNDIDTEEEEAYGNVGPTVHVRYESDVESEVGSDEDIDPLDLDGPARSHRRLVSWDGVKDHVRCRWTEEQERKLVHAQSELARCQKAWSSEQDIWLKCIEALSEEKAAHEGFINNRAKHIGDEQHHFRKACDRNRRRSEQDQLQGTPQRLTQAHRTGSLPVRLGKFRGRHGELTKQIEIRHQ